MSTITKVRIVALTEDNPGIALFLRDLPDDERPKAARLGNHRALRIDGSSEMYLTDGFGLKQRVPLSMFDDRPDDAHVDIAFHEFPADREFPPLEPGMILLKEYVVTGERPDYLS